MTNERHERKELLQSIMLSEGDLGIRALLSASVIFHKGEKKMHLKLMKDKLHRFIPSLAWLKASYSMKHKRTHGRRSFDVF